jgi:hypothetical protein
MTRGQTRMWTAATMAAMVVAAPAAVPAAEAVAVAAMPESQWKLEAGAAYAAAESLSGWGLSLHAGRVQGRHLMFGFVVDSTRLDSGATDLPAGVYPQGFRSTLFGGFFRGLLPMGFVTGYAELALGYNGIHAKQGTALPCDYDGGPNGAFALGAAARPFHGVSLGARASLRQASISARCGAASPGNDGIPLVKSIGMTVAYSW